MQPITAHQGTCVALKVHMKFLTELVVNCKLN